ncbi:DUF4179 domain-containing protein [Psychrobacillus glaciei]|uniref:DUF4179 domain-containing protein n=1 Tax=Psychrobacillus glaciei TaxID=2283160 RepID=A0A5J6SIP3_9BACI|nr:DUF4179 domain-containing protein [Psychrobacillus glaciei]QFF97840.1 DUF4179 domain-containing protein [Psychrobacillus glaciei]
MYEKEEEMLDESRKQLEQIEIPDQQITNAIQQGLLQAKNKKRKRKKMLWTFSVAAILMLTFVTSIRVSPAFASAIASLPGMERFVDLIQFDKGLEAIIENEYYEPIGVRQVKDDMTFTIDGVILDETGMEIFYTLEAPFSIENIRYGNIDVLNGDRNLSDDSSYSFGYVGEKTNRIVERFSFTFGEAKQFNSQQFELIFQIKNEKKTTFTIPFTIKNDIKKGKVYSVNQKVEMDGQKMLVKEITVYPLRVAVNIEFDEQNNMEILQFEDMRIEDEKGELWSSIQNGTSGFGGVENIERTYFLQSNYFKEPKKLYFKFDKVQALPKDESYLLIDMEKKEVLNKPSDGKLEVMNINNNSVEVKIPQIKEDHMYSLFGDAKNANGERIDTPSQSMHGDADGEYNYTTIELDSKNIVNPIKLYLYSYPNYLDGSVSIQIK